MSNPDVQAQHPNSPDPGSYGGVFCTCHEIELHAQDVAGTVHQFDGRPCWVRDDYDYHPPTFDQYVDNYAPDLRADSRVPTRVHPDDACADHGCALLHPGVNHATYVELCER